MRIPRMLGNIYSTYFRHTRTTAIVCHTIHCLVPLKETQERRTRSVERRKYMASVKTPSLRNHVELYTVVGFHVMLLTRGVVLALYQGVIFNFSTWAGLCVYSNDLQEEHTLTSILRRHHRMINDFNMVCLYFMTAVICTLKIKAIGNATMRHHLRQCGQLYIFHASCTKSAAGHRRVRVVALREEAS